MYKIFNTEDGGTVGYVEAPRYIKLADNGCFVGTTEAEAQGIALDGTPYALLGNELEGAAGTVGLTEFDGGAAIAQQEQIVDDLLIAELEG